MRILDRLAFLLTSGAAAAWLAASLTGVGLAGGGLAGPAGNGAGAVTFVLVVAASAVMLVVRLPAAVPRDGSRRTRK